MKRYMRRWTVDQNTRFLVFDEIGAVKYCVTGEHTTLGSNLFICDVENQQRAEIRQKDFLFFHCDAIYTEQERVKLLSNFESKVFQCFLLGIDWKVSGEPFLGNFSLLTRKERTVMTQQVEWKFFQETYKIEILCKEMEMLCLSIAACMNCILPQDKRRMLVAD